MYEWPPNRLLCVQVLAETLCQVGADGIQLMFMLLLIVSLTFQSYKLFIIVWEPIFFLSASSSPERPLVQMALIYLQDVF